jgi:hypothetical protein
MSLIHLFSLLLPFLVGPVLLEGHVHFLVDDVVEKDHHDYDNGEEGVE